LKIASSAGVCSAVAAGSTQGKLHLTIRRRAAGDPRPLDCPAVDVRQERVVVETDRYRVEGMLTLPKEGYRSRVSDHVNRRDHEFFTLLDCELVPLDGSGRDWKTPVLMLARRHIRLIVPASEGA
jgi:hypothetical protein